MRLSSSRRRAGREWGRVGQSGAEWDRVGQRSVSSGIQYRVRYSGTACGTVGRCAAPENTLLLNSLNFGLGTRNFPEMKLGMSKLIGLPAASTASH